LVHPPIPDADGPPGSKKVVVVPKLDALTTEITGELKGKR
jgi:hypothetical protein